MRRNTLFHLIATLTLLLLCSCGSPPSQTHLTQNIMTIDYHITIGDPLTLPQKEKVQQVIDATFQEIDAVYNRWNPNSELSKLNDFPANIPFQLSAQLNHFLLRIAEFVKLSDGRFDPTVEPIQQLWKSKLSLGQVPSSAEIQALKPAVGWDKLHFEGGAVTKQDQRTQIDLGGVAKGYCVDLLVERLHDLGLESLFVEWGGEVRALGYHPSKRPWRVYISNLDDPDPTRAIATVDLVDSALATSGDYFQYWEVVDENGIHKTYCHVFDPITLSPLEVKENSIASASLMAPDCTVADALAKVLMLFSTADEAQQWVKNLHDVYPDLACWIVSR